MDDVPPWLLALLSRAIGLRILVFDYDTRLFCSDKKEPKMYLMKPSYAWQYQVCSRVKRRKKTDKTATVREQMQDSTADYPNARHELEPAMNIYLCYKGALM